MDAIPLRKDLTAEVIAHSQFAREWADEVRLAVYITRAVFAETCQSLSRTIEQCRENHEAMMN